MPCVETMYLGTRVACTKVRVSVQPRRCSLIYARAAMAHVLSCRGDACERGCGLFTGPVLTRVRVVRELLNRSQKAVSVSCRVLLTRRNRVWLPNSRCLAHFVRATSTLVHAVAAAAVPVAVLHRGAAHFSSSSPPPTPQPHSTAQHQQSHDRLTTRPGSWPGAAAKRQSPTRPRSSVV